MTVNFSAGETPLVDLVAETEGLYRETAEGLAQALRRIREGHFDEAKVVDKTIRDLKTALQWVMDERNRVEKLRKDVAGAVGAGALDFGAARDEIGRRLARFRDAGNSG
jgi:predicted Rdx family selenoprotein